MKPCSCMSRMPSSLVAPQTPACVVTWHAELARDLERRLLGELGVARDVEGHLEAEHVVLGAEAALDEGAEVLRGRPLPRALLEVAVGEHEAAGDGLERVDGGLGVVDRLQAVRPVDGGGHAGLDRLERRQQVARVDVLRAEDLAPLEVVEDEVLGERPVGAVAAHRRLPHVAVGVDHARHDDPAGGVDLRRALRHLEPGADRRDLLADDEHVGIPEDVVRVVHGQHGPAAQHDRTAGLDLAQRGLLSLGCPAPFQTAGCVVKEPARASRRPRRGAGAPRPRRPPASGTRSTSTAMSPRGDVARERRGSPRRRTSGGGRSTRNPRRSSDDGAQRRRGQRDLRPGDVADLDVAGEAARGLDRGGRGGAPQRVDGDVELAAGGVLERRRRGRPRSSSATTASAPRSVRRSQPLTGPVGGDHPARAVQLGDLHGERPEGAAAEHEHGVARAPSPSAR